MSMRLRYAMKRILRTRSQPYKESSTVQIEARFQGRTKLSHGNQSWHDMHIYNCNALQCLTPIAALKH